MEITDDGTVKFNGEEIDKLTVGGLVWRQFLYCFFGSFLLIVYQSVIKAKARL